MSENTTKNQPAVILPFQQSQFDRMCAVARACFYVDRSKITFLRLRTCFLLIGPTGSGKTFLARELASEMQVAFLSISVSDWILLGCSSRGGSATWPVIFEFVERHKHTKGVIIFIDELDKCNHDSNWNSYLRSEIFSLCDARIPVAINDTNSESVSENRISEVEDFLRNKTMIVAGAAFQGIWEERSNPTMGFLPTPPKADVPELPDLAKFIQKEMINRFSSEVFILPELSRNDYSVMLETMAEKVPETWQKRFLELGNSRLDQAVKHQKGARFLEEILLTAIVEERGSLANFVPIQEVIEELEYCENNEPEDDRDDADIGMF